MFSNSVLQGFHHWDYTRESWTPPASWFSWFTPITNAMKMLSWTDPTFSFHWRRTHPLGRQSGKRVTNSLAAAHKAKWWDAPLAPWDASRSNIHYLDVNQFQCVEYTSNMQKNISKREHMYNYMLCYLFYIKKYWNKFCNIARAKLKI